MNSMPMPMVFEMSRDSYGKPSPSTLSVGGVD